MSSTYTFAGKQVIIYCGIPVFAAGVLGCSLNMLVFLSLKTFRQSSCVFYLTVMSMVNIGTLFLGFFPRIMVSLFSTDGTEISLFYCKARLYFSQIFIGTSLSCYCLATIDQYFATCTRLQWQLWCNIKLAIRIIIITVIIWILHGIPYVVFYDHVVSSTTNQTTCLNTNYIFDRYRAFVTLLLLIGYFPIMIAALFGSMAFRNVQQLAFRTVPLIRRELDKQLTNMVLLQVLVSIFTLLPYTTVSAVATSTSAINDPVYQGKIQFAVTVTFVFYYISFASPFYIYFCASGRFRRQLKYVLFDIHLSRIFQNQIEPQMTLNVQ
ncbi:unnamed protein product [Adineta steineri]|uniref:G-protein coupled receptors family 1 profile domain-containing protein n=1 Tax=Adineta steineri TaxID=433720 RepID=A0A816DS26_9BILA|nr:unnamed protein product [Adineta steineri]CAF1637540.1 unnamed protein product [Adineta steineri]